MQALIDSELSSSSLTRLLGRSAYEYTFERELSDLKILHTAFTCQVEKTALVCVELSGFEAFPDFE